MLLLMLLHAAYVDAADTHAIRYDAGALSLLLRYVDTRMPLIHEGIIRRYAIFFFSRHFHGSA